MIRLIVPFLLCLLWLSTSAQIDLPKLSPLSKVEQVVGVTTITLEYSRPNMRGRKIFGDLVPYNTYWRTGANRNTKVIFEDPVVVGIDTLAADTFAILTIPGEEEWEVLFYEDYSNWGVPKEVHDSLIAARIKVPSTKTNETFQSLSIAFEDLKDNHFKLAIVWENTKVAIPINLTTGEVVLSSIEETLAKHASDYYAAAVYYFDNGLDVNQARQYIDKGISMRSKSKYYDYGLLAKIQSKQGQKEASIASAQKAFDMVSIYKSAYHDKLYTELIEHMKKGQWKDVKH